MRKPEAMHQRSGLITLMRLLTKCNGFSITIRLFMVDLFGRR
jgi:hypothetical protein